MEIHKIYNPVNPILYGIHWFVEVLVFLASRMPKWVTLEEKLNWKWSTPEAHIGFDRPRDNGENTARSEDSQIWPDIPNASDLANLLHFHYHL